MCNSSLTTLASLSPCSKTLKAVTFILKLRPIHTTDTFFQVSEICRPDVTVPSVPVCRSPDSESPITPSYDISQIINTFVMLYLHLNVIFSITHPEIYYNTLLSVVKLRYFYKCMCLWSIKHCRSDFSSMSSFFEKALRQMWKKKERFPLCCSLGFYYFWKL